VVNVSFATLLLESSAVADPPTLVIVADVTFDHSGLPAEPKVEPTKLFTFSAVVLPSVGSSAVALLPRKIQLKVVEAATYANPRLLGKATGTKPQAIIQRADR